MALLINLIIIFIVIYTVLKRVQEISKKGGEIKVPPASPPITFPEFAEEQPRRTIFYPEPEETPVEPVGESAPSREETFETYQKETAEPEVFSEQAVSYYPELSYRSEKPVPTERTPKPAIQEKTPAKPVPPLVLRFNTSELVRGFLMGEILGVPVSIRKEMRI
jgi:hypothetical protein